jgi:hypothetical protein
MHDCPKIACRCSRTHVNPGLRSRECKNISNNGYGDQIVQDARRMRGGGFLY